MKPTLTDYIKTCNNDKLYQLFDSVICEMNRRKELKIKLLGYKDKNNIEIKSGDILKTPDASFGTAILDADNRPAIESPGSCAVDYDDEKFFNQCEIVANIDIEPDFYEEIIKSTETSSADVDLIIWFDSQTGEKMPEFAKDEMLERVQVLAQNRGFDYYCSSSPRGLKQQFDSLEKLGYFENEQGEDE